MFTSRKAEVDKLIRDLHDGFIKVNYDTLKNPKNEQIISHLRDSIEKYHFYMNFSLMPDNISIERVYSGFTSAFVSGIISRDQSHSNSNINNSSRESDNQNKLLFPNIYQTQINVQHTILDIKQIVNSFNEIKKEIEKDHDISDNEKLLLLDSLKEIESLSDNKEDKISTFHKFLKSVAECSDRILSKPYIITGLNLIAKGLMG